MEISIINETKKMIDDVYAQYHEINNKYYNAVLKFLNKIFPCNSTSILKIKFKKIKLSYEILIEYNTLINKFNLNKELFDIDNFDITDNYDFDDIINIIIIISNNLLDKLNYKMFMITDNNNHKIIKIKNK